MIKNVNNRAVGAIGEQIAVKYLVEDGYNILELNFRISRIGEIDIIAKKNKCISFIEVKTRTSKAFGLPSEAVNWKKQDTIRKIASLYLTNKGIYNSEVRFDVIEILGNFSKNEFKADSINLLQNAF